MLDDTHMMNMIHNAWIATINTANRGLVNPDAISYLETLDVEQIRMDIPYIDTYSMKFSLLHELARGVYKHAQTHDDVQFPSLTQSASATTTHVVGGGGGMPLAALALAVASSTRYRPRLEGNEVRDVLARRPRRW